MNTKQIIKNMEKYRTIPMEYVYLLLKTNNK